MHAQRERGRQEREEGKREREGAREGGEREREREHAPTHTYTRARRLKTHQAANRANGSAHHHLRAPLVAELLPQGVPGRVRDGHSSSVRLRVWPGFRIS